MKTKEKMLKSIGVFVALISLISCMLIISNCSKKSEDNSSKRIARLKNDTIKMDSSWIISLPPADSLTLINQYFGTFTLELLQLKVDSSITNFKIFSDSIKYHDDTCTLYKLRIRSSDQVNRDIAILIFHARKDENNKNLIKTIVLTGCLKKNCTGTCQLLQNGPWPVCLCSMGGDCKVVQLIFPWML